MRAHQAGTFECSLPRALSSSMLYPIHRPSGEIAARATPGGIAGSSVNGGLPVTVATAASEVIEGEPCLTSTYRPSCVHVFTHAASDCRTSVCVPDARLGESVNTT